MLPVGSMLCNPDTETAWLYGPMPSGTPVLLADDPAVYDRIVAAALGATDAAA